MAKKTIAAGVPVAARPIAIEGKHFDEGEPVTGVSEEQLKIAKRLGRVIDGPAPGADAADAEPGA